MLQRQGRLQSRHAQCDGPPLMQVLHTRQHRQSTDTLSRSSIQLHRQPVSVLHAKSVRPSVHTQAGFGFGSTKQKTGKKTDRDCPCGSGLKLQSCCQPVLDSADTASFRIKPATAEACLRARFAAFALKDHHRLVVKTTALDNPIRKGSTSADGKTHSSFENDIKVTFAWMDFKDLNIVETLTESPDHVSITFTAQTRQKYELHGGQPIKDPQWQTIRETAFFVHQPDNGWVLRETKSNWDRDKLQVVN